MKMLENRNALVTGASRGIGKEIAKAFANQGASVVVNYHTREESADDVATEIEKIGMRTWIFPTDTSNLQEVKKMKGAIEKNFGKIDVLVNNAGINVDKTFAKMTEEDWNKVISVDLTGVFNCTHVFLDHVTESKYGRIINITSIVGQMGNIGQVNYAAAKSGIIGLTKALAREMARKNVTVNAIAPGFIETDMVRNMPDKIKEKVLPTIPMGRFGKPEEVAHACVFLASDMAAYITGQVINVNGGMYM
ncbi:MAG: 3-oxoacyl-[acyl-carrier-protein] reductase [Euryarchaeota archaeon]|nr:3-oxoacyl-[acyl-carrier-protein] reductase [Euryarchaeota archaeon]